MQSEIDFERERQRQIAALRQYMAAKQQRLHPKAVRPKSSLRRLVAAIFY